VKGREIVVKPASQRTKRFIEGLLQLERSGDVSGFTQMFAGDAELSKLVHAQAYQGSEGVNRFWQEYLATFEKIRSEFQSVVESGDLAVLEWTAEGSLPGGQPIHYRGVSILEWDGDSIRRFRTYYDSAAFLVNGLQGHR